MPAITEIGDYLESEGVGTLGTNLFLGGLPSQVVEAMSIVQYSGRRPEQVLDGEGTVRIEFPRFQFLSRSATDLTALTNAETAARVLAKVANQLLGTTFYSTITVLQWPGLLRRDDNNRAVMSFNFEAEKESS